jgi:hypothetical protein
MEQNVSLDAVSGRTGVRHDEAIPFGGVEPLHTAFNPHNGFSGL